MTAALALLALLAAAPAPAAPTDAQVCEARCLRVQQHACARVNPPGCQEACLKLPQFRACLANVTTCEEYEGPSCNPHADKKRAPRVTAKPAATALANQCLGACAVAAKHCADVDLARCLPACRHGGAPFGNKLLTAKTCADLPAAARKP